jgi:hypothetical protein
MQPAVAPFAVPRNLRSLRLASGLWLVAAATGSLPGVVGPALAATDLPVAADALLSEDGFGLCVPEAHLDAIWLAFAGKGKSGRVPHVCMSGGCDALPDIATWALAQQYPEDMDLERDEVQARYAAFVAEVCGGPEEPPPTEAPAAEPSDPAPNSADSVPLPPGPLLARALPPLLGTPGVGPPRAVPGLPGGGGGGTPGRPPRLTDLLDPPPSGPPRSGPPPSGPPPSGPPPSGPPPGWPPADPPPGPPPPPPVAVMPLPAGVWLLLSALGLGALVGRRRG